MTLNIWTVWVGDMGKTYSSIDEMDDKSQQGIAALSYEDEKIEMAILCWVPWVVRLLYLGSKFYRRFYPKLILTNHRVLMFKRGWIREKSEDFTLDEITSIEYTKGIFKGKITIQGAGFEETYRTPKDTGQEFATAARESLREDTDDDTKQATPA